MPPVVGKKVRGKKKKQQKKKNDPRKLVILDACVALGRACGWVGDFDDARRYYKRAKEGYEEQLGRDSEEALNAKNTLIMVTCSSRGELIEKLRDLLKRMKNALGEENVVTLETLNSLGSELWENGEYKEAIIVHKRSLAGRTKVLGEDHKDTLQSLNNLGIIYQRMKDYEKALEYYGRGLKGDKETLGKTHPSMLQCDERIDSAHCSIGQFVEGEPFYARALEGYEAQLGKDHVDTKRCAKNLNNCLEMTGNLENLTALTGAYPWL